MDLYHNQYINEKTILLLLGGLMRAILQSHWLFLNHQQN